MNKKQGITTESSIYKIENGFLLTYVVTPYDHTVRLDSSEHKHDTEIYAAFDACNEKLEKQLRRYKWRLKNHHTEYYKTGIEATERLAKILLKELAQEIDFTGVGDER